MITVCGEGLVDLVDRGDRMYQACPGGSPLNVAVGLARLDEPTSLLARLADDPFGRLLRAHLTAAGVSDRDLVHAEEPSTVAITSLDRHGHANYRFYVAGTADWQWQPTDLPDPLPADVSALHTGSLASWIPPGANAIEALLRREHHRGAVTICFDPNVRPALMGDYRAARARVERLVGLADLVKVSDEDLAWAHPDHDPLQVARAWSRLGPRLVVVTRGGRGATAITATGHQVSRPAAAVKVVDTVGAGDAFTAGLLAGLADLGALGPGGRDACDRLDPRALTGLLDRAGLVAGLACTHPGACPPTRAEVDHAQTRHPGPD